MSEIERRRDELAVADDAALIGVITATVGATLGAEGAIFAALVGPYAALALRRLREFRGRLSDSGLDDEAIRHRLESNPVLARLVADAVRGTVESDLAAKRALLAKAAISAIHDDTVVDPESKFVLAANGIDTVDVRLLKLFAVRGRMTLDAAANLWPGAADVLEASVASLTAAGLVFDKSAQITAPGAGSFPSMYELTQFGRAFLERLRTEGLEDELSAIDARDAEP